MTDDQMPLRPAESNVDGLGPTGAGDATPDTAEAISGGHTYGGITLRTTMPVVIEAPERTLLTAGMFAGAYGTSLHAHITGDRVCVGQTEVGEQVWYRIIGWDADHKALILERTA